MLSIRDVSKRYGEKPILDSLCLDVPKGKITTLLGPSGCGKTTLLRIIAGLEHPDTGSVTFDAEPWVSRADRIFVPPQKRNIGLVFQSYAIWPHMSVFDQIAYPLRNRSVAPAAISKRVEELLRMVGLEGLADRPSTALSGGQQQRVAMARALAPSPTLLLLDEPFSNLDVELRGQLRAEVRQLQHRLGVTIILVTHDQLDAFTLSDQVALMRGGSIEQIGTCEDIYERPATEFVRGFVGKSVRLAGTVRTRAADRSVVEFREGSRLSVPNQLVPTCCENDNVTIWLRPEDLHIARDAGDGFAIKGVVQDVMYLGERLECIVDLETGETVALHSPRSLRPLVGEAVFIRAFDDDHSAVARRA